MNHSYQINENSAAEIAQAKQQLDQLTQANQSAPAPRVTINQFGDGSVQGFEIRGNQARMSNQGIMRMSTSEIRDGGPEAGILSTARSDFGPTSRITKSSIVTLPGGIQTSVENATRLGYLRQDGEGKWSEVGNAADRPFDQPAPTTPEAAQDQQQATEAQPDRPEGLDENDAGSIGEEADGFVQEFMGKVPGFEAQAAIRSIVEKGELPEAHISDLARMTSLEPEEVSRRVATIREGYEKQAAAAVDNLGIPDARAFFDWANRSKAADIRKAALHHVTTGSVSGYRGLATEFLADLGKTDPDHLLNAKRAHPDLKVYRNGSDVVVSFPAWGEMTWANAVRGGFIALKNVD